MSPEATSAPRRSRLKRDELRSLLLDAGEQIIAEEGLGAEAGSITFRKVFDRIEAEHGLKFTNASVIGRIWTNLADYRADVLAAAAKEFAMSELDAVAANVIPALDGRSLDRVDDREWILGELCRVGSEVAFDSLHDGKGWVPWLGVLLASQPEQPTAEEVRIREAAISALREANLRWEETHTSLLAAIGFRLRPPFTMEQFIWATGALTEGYLIADALIDALEPISLPTGAGGAEQEWTSYSLAFCAIARSFFEIDPDWTPPTSSD